MADDVMPIQFDDGGGATDYAAEAVAYDLGYVPPDVISSDELFTRAGSWVPDARAQWPEQAHRFAPMGSDPLEAAMRIPWPERSPAVARNTTPVWDAARALALDYQGAGTSSAWAGSSGAFFRDTPVWDSARELVDMAEGRGKYAKLAPAVPMSELQPDYGASLPDYTQDLVVADPLEVAMRIPWPEKVVAAPRGNTSVWDRARELVDMAEGRGKYAGPLPDVTQDLLPPLQPAVPMSELKPDYGQRDQAAPTEVAREDSAVRELGEEQLSAFDYATQNEVRSKKLTAGNAESWLKSRPEYKDAPDFQKELLTERVRGAVYEGEKNDWAMKTFGETYESLLNRVSSMSADELRDMQNQLLYSRDGRATQGAQEAYGSLWNALRTRYNSKAEPGSVAALVETAYSKIDLTKFKPDQRAAVAAQIAASKLTETGTGPDGKPVTVANQDQFMAHLTGKVARLEQSLLAQSAQTESNGLYKTNVLSGKFAGVEVTNALALLASGLGIYQALVQTPKSQKDQRDFEMSMAKKRIKYEQDLWERNASLTTNLAHISADSGKRSPSAVRPVRF